MGIIEKVKEAYKKQREDLEKAKKANYAKNYYKDYSTAGRGNGLVVVITDDINYHYVSRDAYTEPYDLIASMISGITGDVISNGNSIEDLSSNYNYVIITATPTTISEPTTMYVPRQLSEFQQSEIDNFKRQVDEHNAKYPDKVDIRKIKTGKVVSSEDDMSISK